MRAILQRVTEAKVKAGGKIVGEVRGGILILLGIKKGDTCDDAKRLADKVVKLRVLKDKAGKMNLSVKDAGAGILVISQFTLYANTNGGNRPSFLEAEEPVKAKSLYNYFVNSLEESGLDVKTGSFGEYMTISPTLDGPVTIILET